ncbi:MAG: hypothetical protein GPJ04_23250 [Microcystis aeruginosa G13-03]|nr:hypothetical protein [Microcystis aeruginosa G13-03]
MTIKTVATRSAIALQDRRSHYKIGDRTAVTHLKSNIVGFRCLNPTYKIGDRTTRSAIALQHFSLRFEDLQGN